MPTPADARLTGRLLLGAVALLLLAVPFALLLQQVTSEGPVVEVDTAVAEAMHDTLRQQPGLVTVLEVLTMLGGSWFVFPFVGVAAAAWLSRRRYRLAIWLVATAWIGSWLNIAMKLLVGRARPLFDEPLHTAGGYSFPSGHATNSAVCYGAVAVSVLLLLPRRRKIVVSIVAALVVAVIGFTRVALGVHYLSDVLAGFALGTAWLAASAAAFTAWRHEVADGGRAEPG